MKIRNLLGNLILKLLNQLTNILEDSFVKDFVTCLLILLEEKLNYITDEDIMKIKNISLSIL